MPSTHQYEDDDPVVASYNVYMTNPLYTEQGSSATQDALSKLFVLQYPSHRPSAKPYNAARSQKPTQLRLKPRTGMVEVDIPILTKENFNAHTGEKYGQALTESRVARFGGSHGLAGGFASGPVSTQSINLNDIPSHEDQANRVLNTQTLGGKIVDSSEREPIYMLGVFRDDGLHLTHLDAVVQMRPQLHHIDAEEEINQKRFQSASGPTSKVKPGFETGPPRLESKAIELKMKDTREDPKDRNLNVNARLLRDIQADQWVSHQWVDEDEEQSWQKAEQVSTFTQATGDRNEIKHLRSTITNDEWLDKMSVPREDGKKGLRAKLKGRDRERARRKKVEHQRRQMKADNNDNAPIADISSDSDLSSVNDPSDIEIEGRKSVEADVQVKEEPNNSAAAASTAAPVADPAFESLPTTTKKRGRPKRT